MPQDIEEAFTSCKLSLFPASRGDLATECSCPDWANPCKHIAATYYILAEKFDEDPFLIFSWRGRTKEQLTLRLRELRGTLAAPGEPVAPLMVAQAESAAPLSACLDSFWRADPSLLALRIHPEAAEVPDALLRQLGPAPVEIRGSNLVERLLPLYQAMSAGAASWALGKEP